MRFTQLNADFAAVSLQRHESPDVSLSPPRRAPRRLAAAAAAVLATTAATAIGKPDFSEWADTTALGAPIAGGCPIESRNGNELYTAGGFDGTLDVWVYSRSGRHNEFGPRVKVGEPVSLADGVDDFCPTPLAGGWLLFVSDRSGGCGGADMYIARYNLKGPNPRSMEAQHLGCAPDGPNTTGVELSPSLVTTSEGRFLYYSSDVGGDQDIYRSAVAIDGSFGPGEPVAGVNTGFADQQPNVSKNGLEMVFSSNRNGTQDVFSASRESLDEPWANVRYLTIDLGLPTVDGNETRASMSWDRKRLYYGSAGTIFVSHREPGAASP